MSGYYQADRAISQAFLPKHGAKFTESEAYTFLSLFAAYSDRDEYVGGKLISLSAGELVASERYLESRFTWSRTKVRAFKTLLINSQILTSRKDQGETVLILCYLRDNKKVKTRKDTSKKPPSIPGENHLADHRRTNIRIKNKEEGIKNTTIPSESEFAKYCIEVIPASYPVWSANQVELCAIGIYRTYIEQNWKDGFGKAIKNWKTKVRNKFKSEKPYNYGKFIPQPEIKTKTIESNEDVVGGRKSHITTIDDLELN